MKYYISTIADDAREIALKYGFGLEIAEYCTAFNMDELFEETSERVEATIIGVNNLVFHGPFNELFPCAIDPKARILAAERFCQAIELAQEYGAKKLVLHGGFNPYLYFPEWYIEESVKFWKDFMEKVPEDMIICLENVLEQEPEIMLEIVKKTASPKLKLCLDIGHVNAYSKIPVMEWLRTCAPEILHFHVHNNDGKVDSHSSLSEGSIPMEQFLREAAELCPQASVTLEVLYGKSSAEYLKNIPMDVAGNSAEFCFLYTGCSVGGCKSYDRNADDAKDHHVCVDCNYGI